MTKKISVLPKSIKGQMIIMISILGVLQILVSLVIFQGVIAEHLEYHIGQKALSIAKTVARMDRVVSALESGENSSGVQTLTLQIQEDTNAEFIVVGDVAGIRLSHPNAENIGKKFVGGDFSKAVNSGEFYISKSVGTLGPSLRGFAPVKSNDGKIIGFVSVGILESKILKTIKIAQSKPLTYVFMIIFMGLVGASLIAGYVKKITLGLEPKEIAALHKEREIILNSVKEGIIAVDSSLKVRFANKEAERLLGAVDSIVGDSIDYLMPQVDASVKMQEQDGFADEEILINETPVIFNMTPVVINGVSQGLVASFRRKDEMDYLNKELARAKECSELMRVQSHEYSNKLHTISGLIQIEEYEEAKNLILKESEEFHQLMAYLDSNMRCPLIAGMIMGKHNRAKELKISFEIKAESAWLNPVPLPEEIVTVMSNLIENAFDSAIDCKERKPAVLVTLIEKKKSFVAMVEDSGRGVADKEKIFEKGFSTKSDGRGFGLYNVMKSVDKLQAKLDISSSSIGGAKFKVSIPKGN